MVVKLLMTASLSAEQGRSIEFRPDGLATFTPQVARGTWRAGSRIDGARTAGLISIVGQLHWQAALDGTGDERASSRPFRATDASRAATSRFGITVIRLLVRNLKIRRLDQR